MALVAVFQFMHTFAALSVSSLLTAAAATLNPHQHRYFTQRIITALITIIIFVFFMAIGAFLLSELQTPVRYQDATIPLVGKD